MTSMVLSGGRVIDPGTGFDEIPDVQVSDGQVTALGHGLVGRCLLRCPWTRCRARLRRPPQLCAQHRGHRLQALDGLTTALDLQAGAMPVARACARAAEEGRPLNHGFSASWASARGAVLAGVHPVASACGLHDPSKNRRYVHEDVADDGSGGRSCGRGRRPFGVAHGFRLASWTSPPPPQQEVI